MSNARLLLATFAALAPALVADGADSKVGTPRNLAAQVARTPPRVAPPALPADGAGLYRLSLAGALGGSPLTVLLDVKASQVVKAVALPIHDSPVPWPADAGRLTVKDGTIVGPLTVQVMAECRLHKDRFTRADLPKAGTCGLAPLASGTVTLNVACQGTRGTGSYSASWTGGPLPFNAKANTVENGVVRVLREAPRPVPERCDLELQMYAGLADLAPIPATVFRARLTGGALSNLRGYVRQDGGAEKPMKVIRSELTLRDGRLTGRIEGDEGRPFALEISGEALGRQLHGTVTCVDGASRVTTAWLGQLHDSGAWRLPLDHTRRDWTWEHDLPADPALAKQAVDESQRPVLPGKPGKTEFWTWRSLVRGEGVVSVIHPPAFDVRETTGAVKYRFTLRGSKREHDSSHGCHAEFESTKPWHPLTPVWKDLKPGTYQLTIVPLDAAGNAIPGRMPAMVRDRGQPFVRDPVGRVVKEVEFLSVAKRPSFAGPYFRPTRTWQAIALDCSRWERDGAPIPEAPFSLAARNHPFVWAWTGASQAWGALATRALTDDPAERVLAEAALDYLADETTAHQARHAGMINDYKGYTAVSHFLAGAAIDSVVQTGDPKWREIVLVYARALVKLQNDNGSFGSLQGKGTPPGGGWAQWPAGNTEFGASELLCTLGRIRRDLATDEFVEAERKALAWMRKRALPERFFPLYVHHSASQGYSVTQNPTSALMFARYLLELAPAGERDVKLAEELARWAEDYGIDWTRRPAGPQKGRITPGIPAGDRINCDPAPVNLLAAIVFEQLARETGNTLWSAKAKGLAAAVAVACDPTSGYLRSDLDTTWRSDYGFHYNYGNGMAGRGWATQLMREYDALTAGAR